MVLRGRGLAVPSGREDRIACAASKWREPRTHKIVMIRIFQNLTCFIVFGDGCQIYYKLARFWIRFEILNPNRKWQSQILNPNQNRHLRFLNPKIIQFQILNPNENHKFMS